MVFHMFLNRLSTRFPNCFRSAPQMVFHVFFEWRSTCFPNGATCVSRMDLSRTLVVRISSQRKLKTSSFQHVRIALIPNIRKGKLLDGWELSRIKIFNTFERSLKIGANTLYRGASRPGAVGPKKKTKRAPQALITARAEEGTQL